MQDLTPEGWLTDAQADRLPAAARGARAGGGGGLTDAQADRLAAAAGRLGAGARVVEIGSFRGRSTIVLARAAPADAEVVAIDPHLGSDRGPQEFAEQRELGDADAEAFRANLSRAGVSERV